MHSTLYASYFFLFLNSQTVCRLCSRKKLSIIFEQILTVSVRRNDLIFTARCDIYSACLVCAVAVVSVGRARKSCQSYRQPSLLSTRVFVMVCYAQAGGVNITQFLPVTQHIRLIWATLQDKRSYSKQISFKSLAKLARPLLTWF